MTTATVQNLLTSLDGALGLTPKGKVRVKNESKLRANVDTLVEQSALGEGSEQGAARWLIWEMAPALGIFPSSIQGLYAARGLGHTPANFTVPAMNLRALAYDCARAVFRAASALDAGALIFEIARSEMSYTSQRPIEYTTSVLAAAIKEGWRGPVCIQGDHFQVNHKKYLQDPEAEVNAVKQLTAEAVAAGFYNIDVDTSTLVDLSQDTIPEQQADNARRCAELTAYIRGLQPKGITISVGGEIGEVGGKNSTEVELRAFMDSYLADLMERPVGSGPRARRRVRRGGPPGISKISVQTGTSHGGVVLPDGTMADVAVDFDTLKRLSFVARHEYGLAGAVQHGASTLPESAFRKFAECETCEVHLATNFMNMLYSQIPEDLRAEMYEWLRGNAADERKPSDTDEQFFYKTRKKAIGPFKSRLWGMAASARDEVGLAWEKQFKFLFEQ
ncbi:MAG: class II fructose-bisphosphate aldolase, partial [Anaerolineales bacterium]